MNLHAVVSGIGPSEIFAHSHKPIRTAEDLKGLKFRTTGAWAAILKDYFGASPTVLPASEIFTALERRVIDGTEYVTPSINFATGLHNVASYVVLPGVHQPTYVYDALWKKEVWDALRPDLKDKLIAAGRLTMIQAHLKISAADMDAIEKMRAGKNEFVTLDPAPGQRDPEGRPRLGDEDRSRAEGQRQSVDGALRDIVFRLPGQVDRECRHPCPRTRNSRPPVVSASTGSRMQHDHRLLSVIDWLSQILGAHHHGHDGDPHRRHEL